MKYLFRVNKEKWDALIKLRNWKHPISTLAKKTGFTKSYISQMINGGIALSDDFMLALIKVSGNDPSEPSEWASLFEIVKSPISKGVSTDNYAKTEGKRPYAGYSLSRTLRRRDRAANLERLSLPNPIPATDFYDDAVPRRYQTNYRYKK